MSLFCYPSVFRTVPLFFCVVMAAWLCPGEMVGQVHLNEIQMTNDTTLADEDGDFGDWIELYNGGSSSVQMLGWALSDDPQQLNKWVFPALSLQPNEHHIIFASGKNRSVVSPVDHYETPFYPWSNYTYTLPQQEPPVSWRLPGFDTSGWLQGTGGVGTGDEDDGTDIGQGNISVYSRISINLTDVDAVESLYFFADYDDAFVAYINGVEIARVGIGTPGTPPPFDQLADVDHEAGGYQDLPYDGFVIDPLLFQSALVNGENVFSFQVHNISAGSSDLTGNFIVALGMNTSLIQTESAPAWTGLVPEEFNLHTNFKLSQGESVYLTANNLSVDEVELPFMQLGHSYQRSGDGNTFWCVTNEPSPDSINSLNCLPGYAGKPIFSLLSGVYPTSVEVTLEAPNPLFEIRYTLDGSMPDTSSSLYSTSLLLTETVTVSARCFSPGLWPSAVEKNTYLINESDIGLPIVALSVNPDDLWDPVTGLHVLGPDFDPNYPFFGANFWEDWERAGYVEYYDQNHLLQFEGDIGLKIHGGWSRANDQKSFRIQCKDEYGLESMNYPLMSDKPFITSFSGFNLRNGGNDYWGYRFHDALMQRIMNGTNVDYMAYTPVIVFLNGEYWGFMEMREVLDQNWVENNHGTEGDNATIISYKGGVSVINGSDEGFYSMFNYITANDPSTIEFFDTVSSMIDIENYADYIIAETYWCNGDWSSGWSNNTKFWHNDVPGGKWRFMLMDMDFGMGLAGNSPNDDYISQAGDEWYHTDQIFNRMIQNPWFREYFINRYADLMNTAYQPAHVDAVADEMRNEVAPVFQRHAARWGTDADALNGELNYHLQWNAARVPGSRNVVQDHFALTNQVTISLDIQPAGAGRIHISTIEPREEEYPWSGVYYNGVPVKITVIENPGYHFDHWGVNGLFTVENDLRQFVVNYENDESFVAYFSGESVEPAIEISEFMYHDDESNESGDWIEIHNLLDSTLNLSGMTFGDDDYFHRFRFPLNTMLDSGEYVVVAQDTALFYSQYPDTISVMGPFDFGLSNSIDEIRITNHRGDSLIFIHYTDESPWPGNTDGTGRSVEYDTTAFNQNLGSSWMNGCIGGSPGAPFDPACGIVTLVENISDDGWAIWPNPTEYSFYVGHSGDAISDLLVVNMLGATVQRKTNIRSSMKEVDCTDWESGVYVVRVTSASGEVWTQKVVVR